MARQLGTGVITVAVLCAVPVLALLWLGPWAGSSHAGTDAALALEFSGAEVQALATPAQALPMEKEAVTLNNWHYTHHKDDHCPPGQQKKPDSKHFCSPPQPHPGKGPDGQGPPGQNKKN